jgi:CheY-like chemotaxis protein
MARNTVLYVEDEEDDAFFMRVAFNRLAQQECLRVLGDGREALAYLAGQAPYSDREQHPLPQLVLLDLNLPLVSGFDILAWVRSQPQFRSLPVIIFSSSGRPEERERAAALGADHFIVKPTSGAHFLPVARDLQQQWLAHPVGS